MKLAKWMILFFVFIGLSVGSCEDDEESGICLLDMTGGIQCYDCWTQKVCDETSTSQWKKDFESCSEAGYNDYFGNECGYFMLSFVYQDSF